MKTARKSGRHEWICRTCHRRGPGDGDAFERHQQTAECRIWQESDTAEGREWRRAAKRYDRQAAHA